MKKILMIFAYAIIGSFATGCAYGNDPLILEGEQHKTLKGKLTSEAKTWLRDRLGIRKDPSSTSSNFLKKFHILEISIISKKTKEEYSWQETLERAGYPLVEEILDKEWDGEWKEVPTTHLTTHLSGIFQSKAVDGLLVKGLQIKINACCKQDTVLKSHLYLDPTDYIIVTSVLLTERVPEEKLYTSRKYLFDTYSMHNLKTILRFFSTEEDMNVNSKMLDVEKMLREGSFFENIQNGFDLFLKKFKESTSNVQKCAQNYISLFCNKEIYYIENKKQDFSQGCKKLQDEFSKRNSKIKIMHEVLLKLLDTLMDLITTLNRKILGPSNKSFYAKKLEETQEQKDKVEKINRQYNLIYDNHITLSGFLRRILEKEDSWQQESSKEEQESSKEEQFSTKVIKPEELQEPQKQNINISRETK